jgi:hypothetical protein
MMSTLLGAAFTEGRVEPRKRGSNAPDATALLPREGSHKRACRSWQRVLPTHNRDPSGEQVPDVVPLAETSLTEEIAAALDATDKDVELGLVDELWMFRYPVVVGGGTPFLPPVTEDVRLDLIETRTFGSRVIYERYGRARDESE